MASFIDRSWMTTATTGTGTITLGSAVSGYQTFASGGASNGDWLDYVILDSGGAWEHGVGKYASSGTTLTRNLIGSSTGSLLNLSGSATVFVTVAAQNITATQAANFGTGADGSLSSGFGTITLTRDTCYNNITWGTTDQIICNGWQLFAWSGDLSAAGANAIIGQATLNGGSASGAGQGFAPNSLSKRLVSMGLAGTSGGGGNVGAGSSANSAVIASLVESTYGSSGGAGGSGGNGASGGGTGTSSGNNAGFVVPMPSFQTTLIPFSSLAGGTGLGWVSGNPGGGGGGGGGDGTHAGGGGGAGATSPPGIRCMFRLLNTGTNTTAGVIANKGGNGGNGGNAVTGGTNSGGGGGGGGASGGPIWVAVGQRVGSIVTGGLDASSGAGGTAGNGLGSGNGGIGGTSGGAAGIEFLNLAAQSYSNIAPASATNAGSAASGLTGGAGGASKVAQLNL